MGEGAWGRVIDYLMGMMRLVCLVVGVGVWEAVFGGKCGGDISGIIGVLGGCNTLVEAAWVGFQMGLFSGNRRRWEASIDYVESR